MSLKITNSRLHPYLPGFNRIEHIEVGTKWPTSCRIYLHMNFLEWRYTYFYTHSTLVCSLAFNWWSVSTGSVNGLVMTTNSLGHNELWNGIIYLPNYLPLLIQSYPEFRWWNFIVSPNRNAIDSLKSCVNWICYTTYLSDNTLHIYFRYLRRKIFSC